MTVLPIRTAPSDRSAATAEQSPGVLLLQDIKRHTSRKTLTRDAELDNDLAKLPLLEKTPLKPNL
jgi:hypothetical protein